MSENRFNLVDEKWIPVANKGLQSLNDIFSGKSLTALGGNPVQKLSIIKLLLAITQSAWTPYNDQEWISCGIEEMNSKVITYLMEHKNEFWLYGTKPFLQIPAVEKAEIKSYGTLLSHVASGNTTVLTQIQQEIELTDSDKALLVVQMMGFSMGGKKTDNSVVLSKEYNGKSNDKGKPSTSKAGPSLGFLGYLHNYIIGKSIAETIWLNLFTSHDIQSFASFPEGLGDAPWKNMPSGENCEVAIKLKRSYLGRLVPLSRFMLLKAEGVHYTEGIYHEDYKAGISDTSIAVDYSCKIPKAIWVDTEKKPWRQLPALLSFIESESLSSFECPQLRICIKRANANRLHFGIYSGGIRVSSNAGEQYLSGSDDYVESEIFFDTTVLGQTWFANFKKELTDMENISSILYKSVLSYFKTLQTDGKNIAKKATNTYWQLCERKIISIVNVCNDEIVGERLKPIKRTLLNYVLKSYDTYCPHDTARQIEAWAKNRPRLGKYFDDIK